MEDNHNPRNASDQKPGAKNGIHASFAPLKGVLLISDFCPSGLSEKISVFLATKFVVICNNSLRKLILFISLQISGRSRPRYTNPNLISCHSPVSFITLQLIGCLCSYNTPQSFHWLFSLPRMLFPRSSCITFPILQAPA